jgi:hypothetical protein
MWDNRTPNSAALPKTSTPITWRQIESALQDYFGGRYDHDTGDLSAEVEAADFLDDICDDCPANGATLVVVNLTDLAKHIALELGGAP